MPNSHEGACSCPICVPDKPMSMPDVPVDERSERVVEVARMKAAHDWEGLIAWAKEHDCLPERRFADDPNEYTWAGDHETDARHTYPNRERLVNACLRTALADHPHTEDGEADE